MNTQERCFNGIGEEKFQYLLKEIYDEEDSAASCRAREILERYIIEAHNSFINFLDRKPELRKRDVVVEGAVMPEPYSKLIRVPRSGVYISELQKGLDTIQYYVSDGYGNRNRSQTYRISVDYLCKGITLTQLRVRRRSQTIESLKKEVEQWKTLLEWYDPESNEVLINRITQLEVKHKLLTERLEELIDRLK